MKSIYSKMVAQLGLFESDIMCIASTLDGAMIAIAPEKGDIELWDVATGTHIVQIAIPTVERDSQFNTKENFQEVNSPYSLALSDDGLFVAASFRQTGNIYIWTFEGELLGYFQGEKGFMRDVRFLPGTSLLLIVLRDTRIQLWDASTQKIHTVLLGVNSQQSRLLAKAGYVYNIACSPYSPYIALDFTDKHTCISLLEIGMEREKIVCNKQRSFFWNEARHWNQLQYRQNTQQIYHLSQKAIEGYDIHQQKSVGPIQYAGIQPMSFCFSPQGDILAFADYDGLVYLWDLEKHTLLSQFDALEHVIPEYLHYDRSIQWMNWLPQSHLLATAGIKMTDGSGMTTIKLWQIV
ncbi:WD40 repeat domain-containing protein [Tengunoibacter tsumagoiensis]|nr:hypothetical protein [Tengunoibacter tsumagoiensis]